MRLTWRDGLATVFVFVAVLLYVSWLTGMEVLGTSSAHIVGGVVLGLGLAASVTAVVYGVGAGLFRASKAYLAIASMIGLAALVAGVIALVSGNEMMLGALVFATAALWAMSTVRHMLGTESRVDEEAGHLSFRGAA
jgi:hypothetical protein